MKDFLVKESSNHNHLPAGNKRQNSSTFCYTNSVMIFPKIKLNMFFDTKGRTLNSEVA